MKINTTGRKSKVVKKLIFDMLDVFDAIEIPLDTSPRKNRSLERMAIAVMACGQIKQSFEEAISSEEQIFYKSRDIINFCNTYYSEKISSGSYDDIRRKDLLLPLEAMIVVRSSSSETQATNDPSRGYALSPQFVTLLKKWNTASRREALIEFKREIISLKEELERKRNLEKIPVTLSNGNTIELSPKEHNLLQKAIIEVFLPIFGAGADVLYIGDTSDKFLYLDQKTLSEIGYFTVEHEELPDIIAYNKDKNLLFLIEAFHSTGQWSEIRLRKLKEKLTNCVANVVYITAFETIKAFKQHSDSIAWETEVWIAEKPEHMIHFNGYKFLEIHK